MKVVKILINEDGVSEEREWCAIIDTDSERTLCKGEVFGFGEGSAKHIEKEGKVTCLECINILKYFKQYKY